MSATLDCNLAEAGCGSISKGTAEVLGGEQARGQAVHTEAFGVQKWIRQWAHLRPVDIQHARPQLLPQELWLGPGCGVLLHVLHKTIAFGKPCGGAIHQKATLQVTKWSNQLLKLLLGEGPRQVCNAQQSIGGLQLHRDLLISKNVLVEVFNSTLSLFAIQQRHKCWVKIKRLVSFRRHCKQKPPITILIFRGFLTASHKPICFH